MLSSPSGIAAGAARTMPHHHLCLPDPLPLGTRPLGRNPQVVAESRTVRCI